MTSLFSYLWITPPHSTAVKPFLSNLSNFSSKKFIALSFVKVDHKDYKMLIKDNNIKPVKRRNGKNITIDVKCPHCRYQLNLYHHRDDFDVYRCKNDNCPFYLKNKSSLNNHDKQLYLKHPKKIKLRYIYCKFNIKFPTLTKDYREFIQYPIDISRAYSSQYIIGLCLTYHVNYGLSYRQTASILKDVHEVYISYKTVENYCKAASSIVHPVLELYPYELSDTIAADETYIKILGKTNYIFFYLDAIKKIVTSYRVYEK